MLEAIKTHYAQLAVRQLSARYYVFEACWLLVLICLFTMVGFGVGWLVFIIAVALCALGVTDLRQTKSSVLRNYPVIGHACYLMESVRPELRQYFLESDSEATPFSRAQRSLVYQRAKGESDKRPFGTQLDVKAIGYEWVNHSTQPTVLASHDFRVTIVLAAPSLTLPVFLISPP